MTPHPCTPAPLWRTLRSAALALLLPLLNSLAAAAPIVGAGSSYSVYLAGETSGNALSTAPALFDANPAIFSRAGLTLSLTESQVDRGNGKHTITIKMSADGDLFPAVGEAALVGMGSLGTPLSFMNDVYLDSGRISFFGADDTAYHTSTNLADDYRTQYFSGAWNGYFALPNSVFFVGNAGGRDTRAFSFVFEVTELNAVPEPHGMALAGLALFALAATRRR